jgi:hypothetical protein
MKKTAIKSLMMGVVISTASILSVSAQSWLAQGSGFSAASRALESLDMPKAGVAWGIGRDGSGSGANVREFTRTINGGATWTSGEIKTTTSNSGNRNTGLAHIMALDERIAYVASYIAGTGGINGVFKTKDAGLTWTKLNTTEFTKSASFLNVVHFWDEKTGCALGDPESGEFEFYTTTDSGKTWTRVPGANIPDPVNAEEYGTIGYYEAFGNSIWYPTTTGRILYSTDKGLTWNSAETPYYDAQAQGTSNPVSIPSLTFKDANNGLGIVIRGTGINDVIIETNDGGVTWTEKTDAALGGLRKKSDILFVPNSNKVVVVSAQNENFGSAMSSDGGATWTRIDTGVNQYTSVAFFDENNGFAGGFVTTDGTTSGAFKFIPAGNSSQAPKANDDIFVVSKNTPTNLAVLANDFDADGTLDPATVVIGTNPTNGTVTVDPTDGSVRYIPTTDYVGADSFTYTVKDDAGNTSNSATVNITVSPGTGINAKNATALVVYPNPANGIINISTPLAQATTMNVYNNAGQLVQSIMVQANTTQIDLTSLANGNYILNMVSGNTVYSGTVQINK